MTGRSLASLRQIGLFWAVVLYALVNVLLGDDVVSWVASKGSTAGEAAKVAAGSVSLLLLLAAAQYLALRVWGRRLLRQWVYTSSSGNYGLATFSVDGGDLAYAVDLYPDAQAVLDALQERPGYVSKCLGHASSQAVTYKDNRVDLIYAVENAQTSYSPREGILSLQMMHGGSGMRGYWRSSSETGEARRGELNFMSVKDFRAVVEA